MTVPVDSIDKVTANGNGVADEFSFSPIVIYASTDMTVTKVATDGSETLLTKGTGPTNYSVHVSLYPGTGYVKYPASSGTNLATGESLVMKPVYPLSQTVNLENQGGSYRDILEKMVDRTVRIALQQQEELDRTLKFAVSDPDASVGEVPAKGTRLGKFLYFNATTGAPEVQAGTTDVAVSAFWEAILDDTTLSTSLASMGLSSDMQDFLKTANDASALATLGVSAFAQTVLDDADAAAARATLEVPARNAIINGSMAVWQRGTSFVSPTAGRRYSPLTAGRLTGIRIPNIPSRDREQSNNIAHSLPATARPAVLSLSA